jgi:predicted ATPase/transcriptional regulator with XRE-family HTH domain
MADDMDQLESFARWVKRRRRALDLTQLDLAELIGYSPKTVEKIESGGRRPSKQLVELLAQVLHISNEERQLFAQLARGMESDGYPPNEEMGSSEQPTGILADTTTARLPRTQHPNNLPTQLNSFVGRTRELARIRALLSQEGVRLLVLTGPPGVGKTRLALQAAGDVLPQFKDGVFFVSLVTVTEPTILISTIATTFGIRERARESLLEQLKEHLRNKEVLLLLDNFEQVAESAPLLSDILESTPDVKILVTSRHVLHIYGEYCMPVDPLSLPDWMDPEAQAQAHTNSSREVALAMGTNGVDGSIAGAPHCEGPSAQEAGRSEAVQLFIARAEASRPGFRPLSEDISIIARICLKLEGLPLAIELAAARVPFLPPQTILTRLSSRLKLLTRGARNLPARQQTLRNAIEWSYDLLDEAEKKLFRRLAVFAGGRTLEAIEAICNLKGDLKIDMLDGVSSLVDKSLLQQREGLRGEPRFVMLETIHEYANERLEESGEGWELRLAHAQYFLQLAESVERELHGSKQAKSLDRLEVEHDNLRSALQWAMGQEQGEIALRLSASLHEFWTMRGYLSEGRAWLEGALKEGIGAPAASRAKALMATGVLSLAQGDLVGARTMLEESISLFRELGDKQSIVWASRSLGNGLRYQGDYKSSYTILEPALILARELGNKWDIAILLGDLGIVAHALGDEKAARARYDESLELMRELSDTQGIAMMLVNQGELSRAQGDYDEAYSLYSEGLVLARKLRHKWGTGMVLHNLGHVASHQGKHQDAWALFAESLQIFYELRAKRDIAYCLAAIAGVYGVQRQPERAAVLFAAAQVISNSISSRLDPADETDYERNLADTKAQMSDAKWAQAWERGEQLSLDQAVDFALEEN